MFLIMQKLTTTCCNHITMECLCCTSENGVMCICLDVWKVGCQVFSKVCKCYQWGGGIKRTIIIKWGLFVFSFASTGRFSRDYHSKQLSIPLTDWLCDCCDSGNYQLHKTLGVKWFTGEVAWTEEQTWSLSQKQANNIPHLYIFVSVIYVHN